MKNFNLFVCMNSYISENIRAMAIKFVGSVSY